MKNDLTLIVVFLILFSTGVTFSSNSEKVLVFTKTTGYRHESIETGINTIKELGNKNNFEVVHTELSSFFSIENLKQYKLVIFLNTTGNVLNEVEEQAFEIFIKNGGSFMGIHSASDTEFEWPWFGKLVGAYFLNHPKPSEATMVTINHEHPATKHLPENWVHYDEWYNFKSINPDIKVLLNLDETTYEGGTNGVNHPIAWFHEFDGGRVFYTGLGHTKESYLEPAFKQHLLGGILYCLRR